MTVVVNQLSSKDCMWGINVFLIWFALVIMPWLILEEMYWWFSYQVFVLVMNTMYLCKKEIKI